MVHIICAVTLCALKGLFQTKNTQISYVRDNRQKCYIKKTMPTLVDKDKRVQL